MTVLKENAIIFPMLILRFAFRNLIRHWRRTSLTILAMTFGLAINFWLDCMLRGRNEEVVKLVTGSYTGNFQIYNKLFFEEKLIKSQLEVDENLIHSVLQNKAEFSARTHLPSLISSGENSVPILLQGIRPLAEKNVSTISSSLKEGDYLTDVTNCSPGDVLIGAKLAKILKVDLGEKVVLLTQSADGNLGNELFRVKGIYDTGSSNFDKAYVFTQEKCAFILGQVQAPHEITIRVPRADDQEAVFANLKEIIKPEQLLTTWQDSLPAISRMIKVNNSIMGLVSVILLVVVILGFVNTLLMSVLERTREIGMMMAIGITPGQVQWLIITEALLIAVFSSVMSIVFGFIVVKYYQINGFDLSTFVGETFDANQINLGVIIYPVISIWPFVKVIGFSLVTVFLSVFLPAYRASRLSPLDALQSL